MKRETKFRQELVDELEYLFPGSLILKPDPQDIQGIPDLLILFRNKWAALECKRSLRSPFRPNQEYYLEIMDDMSFASMICPENREAVLYELQQTFSSRGTARIS